MKTLVSRHRLLLVALVLLPSVGCDRLTKVYAEENLLGAGRISLLRDTVRVEYAENRGAFLSLGANLPEPLRGILLTGGVAVMVVGLLGFALVGRNQNQAQVLAFALIASGGVGNLWDRIARGGAVVDFLNLGIGPLRTGIFNVADIAIVAGGVLLAVGARKQAPPLDASAV